MSLDVPFFLATLTILHLCSTCDGFYNLDSISDDSNLREGEKKLDDNDYPLVGEIHGESDKFNRPGIDVTNFLESLREYWMANKGKLQQKRYNPVQEVDQLSGTAIHDKRSFFSAFGFGSSNVQQEKWKKNIAQRPREVRISALLPRRRMPLRRS